MSSIPLLVSILQRLRLQSVAVLFEYPELEQIGSVRSYCTLVERPYMQVARDLRKAILLDGVSEGGDDTVLFAVHARAGGGGLLQAQIGAKETGEMPANMNVVDFGDGQPS